MLAEIKISLRETLLLHFDSVIAVQYSVADTADMKHITWSELQTLRKSGGEYALFDVRESAEAHGGHIFGATFLPRRSLMLRIKTLVPRWDTPIVVYDQGEEDQRGARAASTLERSGYDNVLLLVGGWRAWCQHGGEQSQGSNVPSKWFGETVQEHGGIPVIQATSLHTEMEQGRPYRVCDIRSPEEFQRFRVPGAVGVFGTDCAWAAGDLIAGSLPVVVHCSGRTRSIIACQSLRLLGVSNVQALENGTMGWRLNGYALEKGAGLREFPTTAESRELGRSKTVAMARKAGAHQVDANTLSRWLEEREAGRFNLYLLDVRQLPEYTAGHLPGATALPGGLAIQRTDEFLPVRAAQIVLVDDDEARASLAAYWLRAMGLPKVAVLEGGLGAWRESGRTTHAGRDRAVTLDAGDAGAVIEKVSLSDVHDDAAKFRLLYVDTQARFLAGRPAGTEWVSFGNIEDALGDLDREPEHRVTVLIAESESLAMSAALNGYLSGGRNIRVLEGGTAAWRALAYPLESGPTAMVPRVQDVVVQPYDAGDDAIRDYLCWEQELTRRPFPSLPLYAEYGKFIQENS